MCQISFENYHVFLGEQPARKPSPEKRPMPISGTYNYVDDYD